MRGLPALLHVADRAINACFLSSRMCLCTHASLLRPPSCGTSPHRYHVFPTSVAWPRSSVRGGGGPNHPRAAGTRRSETEIEGSPRPHMLHAHPPTACACVRQREGEKGARPCAPLPRHILGGRRYETCTTNKHTDTHAHACMHGQHTSSSFPCQPPPSPRAFASRVARTCTRARWR